MEYPVVDPDGFVKVSNSNKKLLQVLSNYVWALLWKQPYCHQVNNWEKTYKWDVTYVRVASQKSFKINMLLSIGVKLNLLCVL